MLDALMLDRARLWACRVVSIGNPAILSTSIPMDLDGWHWPSPAQVQGGVAMRIGKVPVGREQRAMERIVVGCSYALGLSSIGAALLSLALV